MIELIPTFFCILQTVDGAYRVGKFDRGGIDDSLIYTIDLKLWYQLMENKEIPVHTFFDLYEKLGGKWNVIALSNTCSAGLIIIKFKRGRRFLWSSIKIITTA